MARASRRVLPPRSPAGWESAARVKRCPPRGPSADIRYTSRVRCHIKDLLWFDAVRILNGSGPNQKGKYKSAYMRKGFPPEQIKTIYKYLTKEMPPQVA